MRSFHLSGAVAIVFMASAAQAASDGERIAEMANQCWVLPENTDYRKASAIFEVQYDATGELVDIVAIEYQPVRNAGKLFALSAQQALQTCAAKTTIKSRTVRVVMKYVAPADTDSPLKMKRSIR